MRCAKIQKHTQRGRPLCDGRRNKAVGQGEKKKKKHSGGQNRAQEEELHFTRQLLLTITRVLITLQICSAFHLNCFNFTLLYLAFTSAAPRTRQNTHCMTSSATCFPLPGLSCSCCRRRGTLLSVKVNCNNNNHIFSFSGVNPVSCRRHRKSTRFWTAS